MQISFAIFFAISNAISFANQCNFLCTPACKTNIQGPPGKGGVEVLRPRDQLQVSGKSYAILLSAALFQTTPCPAPGRSCSVLNHPYLVLPGDAQCSHSSHSSAPPLAADLLYLPSFRTLLFSSKPPLPSAARRYPVLPQLPQQCSHSSHSSAPTAPTAVLPQLPQLPQLP